MSAERRKLVARIGTACTLAGAGGLLLSPTRGFHWMADALMLAGVIAFVVLAVAGEKPPVA